MRSSSQLRSTSRVIIRKATPEDLPQLQALEREADTAAHWNEREYDALFATEAPRRVALVVADEGDVKTIFGFVIARSDVAEWEIENVVVAGVRRRSGAGSSLVRELLREAERAGATSVLLEVRESNLAARRLYEKFGFSQVGRRPGYYRAPVEDALVLKISIAVP
jgi:ribosomal-protein-alanine N-acetyltransferase